MAARPYLFLAVTSFLAGARSELSDSGSNFNRDWKNSVGTGDSKTVEKHLFSPTDGPSPKYVNDYSVDESNAYRVFSNLYNDGGTFNPFIQSKQNKQQPEENEENKYKVIDNLPRDDESIDHLRYLEMELSNLETRQSEKQKIDVNKQPETSDPSTTKDDEVQDLFNANDQPLPFVAAIVDFEPNDYDMLEEMEYDPKQTVVFKNITSRYYPKQTDNVSSITKSRSDDNNANKPKIATNTYPVTKENTFHNLAAKVLQKNIHEFRKNLSECLKEVEKAEKAPFKVLSPKFESPTHANCLIACVLKRNQILEGFNINRDNLLKLVHKFYKKNSKAVKKLSKNLNKCIEMSRKYKNECDIAAMLNACTNDIMGSTKNSVHIKY